MSLGKVKICVSPVVKWSNIVCYKNSNIRVWSVNMAAHHELGSGALNGRKHN